MSELMNISNSRMDFRRKLLATASVFVLLAVTSSAEPAKASDGDEHQPQFWIELGGQINRMDEGQELFTPPLMAPPPVGRRPSIFTPPQQLQKLPHYSVDEYGKIAFEPENTDWVFSVSALYGRSTAQKQLHQQTYPVPPIISRYGVPVTTPKPQPNIAERFADTATQSAETHLIADFRAGRDVGIGMFGAHSTSTVSLGVRFAQFTSKSNIALKSDPDWHFSYKYFYGFKIPYYQIYHTNKASLKASHNFRGFGPSLSWDASAPLMGDAQSGTITFDWGVNAAILFGKQKSAIHHQSTGEYRPKEFFGYRHITAQPTPVNLTRVRTVTVPNIGGMAGLSFRYANAKVSFGYRADFFWGAMDMGIDTAKKENVGFYGPFASVSVGLGG